MIISLDCHIEAIRAFHERTTKRAQLEMTANPKKIEGAHLRALMREKEACEAEWLKSAPERVKADKEAKAKAALATRTMAELQRKCEKLELENKNYKAEFESIASQKAKLALERKELDLIQAEIIAKEIIIDTERKRSFESLNTKPLDLIQIDPTYLTRPELRGCIGVVTEVKPDGASKVYVQGIGKDGMLGDVTFAIIPDVWCKKVGIANWHYSPAIR